MVQGDTTSAFISALAAFYSKIPVAHIEAGLRTNNLASPWPEEAHRCLIDRLASYFFVPTNKAKDVLVSERVAPNKIWVVGNTSIDAIRSVSQNSNPNLASKGITILVTIHRRENHGNPLKEVCLALLAIAKKFQDINIMFIMHPNQAIKEVVKLILSDTHNIQLLEPLDYGSFIQLLQKCTLVITDSGGIQEEITFLGKAALIVRETTERNETLEAGNALLVGTQSAAIINHCQKLLENPELLVNMSNISFPYGDGYAAERIANILNEQLNGKHMH